MNTSLSLSLHRQCLIELFSKPSPTPGHCGATFDAVLCWPETPNGTESQLPCPNYDSAHSPITAFATRMCHENATWSMIGDYNDCVQDGELSDGHVRLMYLIYWVGYSLSLVVCLFALAVFLRYRSLWCLRNIIHSNIILCFFLHNVTWICYSLFHHELQLGGPQNNLASCLFPITLLKYFIAAAFFWMFVEGLHIFVNVLFAFYAPQIRFWMCFFIGWGVPFILIVITLILRQHDKDYQQCWHWKQAYFDFVIIVPMLILILLNVVFLCVIMYVVMSKLRLTVEAELQRYKMGIRALLILCPLLGINYALVLFHPSRPAWLSLLFHYYSVLFSSAQGLLVALFYCFRNTEVQECLHRTYSNVKLIRLMSAERRAHDTSRLTLLSNSPNGNNINPDRFSSSLSVCGSHRDHRPGGVIIRMDSLGQLYRMPSYSNHNTQKRSGCSSSFDQSMVQLNSSAF